MNAVDLLLHDLNNMFPVSAEFGNDLRPMMIEKFKKDKYVFLKPGKLADKAWQLLSGHILAFSTDDNGKEVVAKIYFPRQIVTDLDSFFGNNKPVNLKYTAIGDVHVLEILRKNVLKLDKYDETDKLIQYIMLEEKSTSDTAIKMLRMPVSQRVKTFLELYNVEGLPDQYCASILDITENKYRENKLQLEKTGAMPVIKNKEPLNTADDLEHTPYLAHKVKAYLIKNYTRADIGSIKQIAALFNTTDKTLSRLFKKALGISIPHFIENRRLEKASELLAIPGAHVGEVARAVGYKTINHFSRVYTRFFGYSPKETKKYGK